MLSVNQICVEYHKVPAVRNVSFHVEAREIVCFVGPNGAGKSTSAMTVAGLKRPSSGTVMFDGQPIAGMAPEDIARLGISLVPEGRHIFTRMSVLENLMIGTGMKREVKTSSNLEKVYSLFPILKEFSGRVAGALSGGQQQQLAIARAIMTEPRLMIVDEPSLGLAPQFVDLVFSAFRVLRDEGMTLLVIEQSTKRAMGLSDRVYLLRSGEVVMDGPPATLEKAKGFEAAYFG